jgi:hypothetical protein
MDTKREGRGRRYLHTSSKIQGRSYDLMTPGRKHLNR